MVYFCPYIALFGVKMGVLTGFIGLTGLISFISFIGLISSIGWFVRTVGSVKTFGKHVQKLILTQTERFTFLQIT